MVAKGTAYFLSVVCAALALAAAPVMAQSAGGPGRGKAALSVRGKFIDQRIAEFMEKNDVPGLSMAIVQAPYIPRSAGYGRASLADDALASTRTMWNIGPLTQGFTTVAVFQLHEAQKLDIREPVAKYLTNLPAAWAKTTVLELLQHASGIPDYRTSAGFKADPGLQARRAAGPGRRQASAVRARYQGAHERHRLPAARADHRAGERDVVSRLHLAPPD